VLIESLLLQPIQRDLFTEEGFTVYREAVVRELAARRKAKAPTVTQAHARLATVEQEIENIMTAIRAGILTPSTKSALEQAERERERLLQAIQGPKKGPDQLSTLLPTLLSKFKKVLDDMAVISQREVDKARGILRQLVGGSIILQPTTDGRERFLTAELSGDYSGLVRLVVGPKILLVEGRGVEPPTPTLRT
jgi:site-specific DNA recombinase